tara:strand:+ start:2267 stop:2614 length:348 start_codon:yes stop_codon:yes gene_type:complete
MAFNYTPLNTTAKTLITNFGQSVTFSRIAETYNITSATSTSTSTYAAVVAIIDESKEEQGETSVISVTHNAVAHSDTPILVGDTAVINSDSYRVVSVREVKPATTVVFYELQLRG